MKDGMNWYVLRQKVTGSIKNVHLYQLKCGQVSELITRTVLLAEYSKKLEAYVTRSHAEKALQVIAYGLGEDHRDLRFWNVAMMPNDWEPLK